MCASYDAWHDEQEAADETETPTAPWHLATLRHLPDVRGKRVLEIGCGRGLFSRALAERGADLVAADFSPSAVEHAAARLRGLGVSPIVADIQEIPFPDESFDVVISQETLEHVPDSDRGLRELVRVTRRGGTVIVTGPNYLNLLGIYRVALRLAGRPFTEMGQPVNLPLLLHRQVRKIRRYGCRIEVVEGAGVPLPIPRYKVLYLPARPQWLMKWTALGTIVVAQRL